MPPKKPKARQANKKKNKVRVGRVRPVRTMLDAGAMAHRRLLLDPCNAPLAGPVYSGSGSGQYRRYRTLITAEGQSVEGCYVFQLGTNSFIKASHVAATFGSTYTFSSAAGIFPMGLSPTVNDTDSVRCIAGCVKVRYLGTESARAGTIGLLTAPHMFRGPASQSNGVADMTACPIVNRVGEVQHEAKFVPSNEDQEYTVPTRVGLSTLSEGNSTITVVYRGTPAATIQFEITAIYEVETTEYGVVSTAAPASGTTLNQLLRSLGPISNWAYGHIVAPTIRAAAGAAYNTMYSTATAAARGLAAMAL